MLTWIPETPPKRRVEVVPFSSPQTDPSSSKGKPYLLVALFLAVPGFLLGAGIGLYLLSTPSALQSMPKPGIPSLLLGQIDRFSGLVEISRTGSKEWTAVTRKNQKELTVRAGDKIRTGANADIDFQIPEVANLRLKDRSSFSVVPGKTGGLVIQLGEGSALIFAGVNPAAKGFEVQIGRWSASVKEAAMMVRAGKPAPAALYVLEGSASVRPARGKSAVTVAELEFVTLSPDGSALPVPAPVSAKDWRLLDEIHELEPSSAADEKEQADLRQGAGTLFRYVLDEGVFFTPKWSFARRKFYRDPQEAGTALRLDYNVYLDGSFSGLYFKTRDLDLAKLKRISLKLKGDPKRPVPAEVRIEIKNRHGTIRGYAVKPISREERLYSFDLSAAKQWSQTATKPAPVAEIVLVVENAKVGALNKASALYLKELNLE